jgi:hypothetical protein
MATTPEPDPVPVADPPLASVAVTGPPVETAEPTSKAPVVVATENHLTVFRSGDVEVTHAGVALPRKQADELTEQAARHNVRLIDITPKG